MRSLESRQRFFTKRTSLLLVVVLVILGTFATGAYRYSRPFGPSAVKEVFQVADNSALPVAIEWPAEAQASIGTVKDGILASEPNQQIWPTASTAKIIAALTILKEKPLTLGEPGPILTIDANDMRLYNDYFAAGGSLVAVSLGEQLSQYQMLQGILIRSGNNLADSLAIWAFGSLSSYQIAAQKLVDELGMTNTTVGTDASGLSETTTSTADDLTRLGIAAMKNAVIRDIVKQPSSDLPIDGIKPSTNWMLGQNGVVGIKTGSLPSIGGVFIIASDFTPEGEDPITIVGTVQGAPNTYTAISQSGQLVEAAKPLFIKKTVVKRGDVIATVTSAWGESTDVIATEDLTTFGWKYSKTNSPRVVINKQPPFEANATIGSVILNGQVVDAVAATAIHPPSWQWRVATSR